jgi:hypothetical protein
LWFTYDLSYNVKVRVEEINYCGNTALSEAVSNTETEKRATLKWISWEIVLVESSV